MASEKTSGEATEGEPEITLGLLNAVQENSAVTQRSMARELGIALGLANAYLKRCVRKGLIKVRQIPPNRYAYYLTPKGFTEKSRLTTEYLSSSFTFFRRARGQYGDALDYCMARGWRRIALAGTGELAEVAILCAMERDAHLVGLIDTQANRGTFASLPVAASASALGDVDAIIVTDLRAPQTVYDALVREIAPERVRTPRLLGILRGDEPRGVAS